VKQEVRTKLKGGEYCWEVSEGRRHEWIIQKQVSEKLFGLICPLLISFWFSEILLFISVYDP
jgi:hypothetical protein